MKTLGTLAPDQRKEFGARVNTLKGEIEGALSARKVELDRVALNSRLDNERVDVSLPARPERVGHIHPLSQVMDEASACSARWASFGPRVRTSRTTGTISSR